MALIVRSAAATRDGRSLRARLRLAFIPFAAAAVPLALGCQTRPVTTYPAAVDTEFLKPMKQSGVEKVDLLFMIDDSASMGDKQAYLKAAIPDLIARFVTPNCVSAADPTKYTGATAGSDGTCPDGSLPEFQPVKDIHIGIITSSLGGRGSQICETSEYSPHARRNAHLVATGPKDAAEPDAQPAQYLSWFPQSSPTAQPLTTPIADAKKLEADFQDMVSGVGEDGCGLEAQLESVYRFLVQPDPWGSVDTSSGIAQLKDYDTTILQQRHDFLRPDSLVAIIDLSDENDSDIDPRAGGGKGWQFMNPESIFSPQRGTSACDATPNDPACAPCTTGSRDPNCQLGPYAQMDPDVRLRDNNNLRHVHMKRRYGQDLQFPMSRYVQGLTAGTVPNRDEEHPAGGPYAVNTGSCTNPLFAAQLPDGSVTDPAALCKLPAGTRSKDQVFFAHIGGVPNDLLHFDPSSPQNSLLTKADWVKILGQDPDTLDTTGIDPRMIESMVPRTTLGLPTDWDSSKVGQAFGYSDLMYACTFDIAARDCSNNDNSRSCDCPASDGDSRSASQLPLCDPSHKSQQIKAKAYPTIRELDLARRLGTQGIVSSLCPKHTTPDPSLAYDPDYGYRPAVAAIIDHLKGQLAATCVPRALTVDKSTHNVPCLVLEVLPDPGDQSACAGVPGLSVPDESVLNAFRMQQRMEAAPGENPDQFPVCAVAQLPATGPCAASQDPGWCYVDGGNAGLCQQAIQFSKAGNPKPGTRISLQCLEKTE